LHHPAYDHDLIPYPYDPARAARLLSEAGWEDLDGDGIREKIINGRSVPFSFTFLLTQSSRAIEQVATMVQNSARRVGIEIKLSKVDWSVLTSRLRSRDFEATSFIWELNHDLDLYPILDSKGRQNIGQWKNKEMDILVDKGRYIMDETIRNLVYRRAHEIIYEEQPYTSTFVLARSALIRRDVRGVYTSDHWYQEYDMWLNDPQLPVVPPEERHPGNPGAPPYDETGR
jgi:peptide/nickel transport system substrate-binding protein